MKYILKQKFHPNQVEEIGHVFEEESNFISYKNPFIPAHNSLVVRPHEIALLIHAGFLEAEKEYNTMYSTRYMQAGQIHECAHCTPEKGYDPTEKYGVQCTCKCHSKAPEQKIDLWADFPPEGTKVWTVSDRGHTEPNIYNGDNVDIFRLKTKNCHRTKESADEALRVLKSKYEIE